MFVIVKKNKTFFAKLPGTSYDSKDYSVMYVGTQLVNFLLLFVCIWA